MRIMPKILIPFFLIILTVFFILTSSFLIKTNLQVLETRNRANAMGDSLIAQAQKAGGFVSIREGENFNTYLTTIKRAYGLEDNLVELSFSPAPGQIVSKGSLMTVTMRIKYETSYMGKRIEMNSGYKVFSGKSGKYIKSGG